MRKTVVLMLALLAALSVFAMPVSADGLTNEWMDTNGVEHPVGCYFAQKRLDTVPATFEAWVYLPQERHDQHTGIVIGNCYSSAHGCFSLEILEQGVPVGIVVPAVAAAAVLAGAAILVSRKKKAK